MPINRELLRRHLQGFAFADLFNELGWDNPADPDFPADSGGADGTQLALKPLAQKRGVHAFLCPPLPDGSMPPDAVRKRIESALARSYPQNLLVFADAKRTAQRWLWTRRDPGRPAAGRQEVFHKGEAAERLLQKLEAVHFSLEEEGGITHLDVVGRLRAGFDVEPVTKKFYAQFKAEADALAAFVRGLPATGIAAEYRLVLVNRLMFLYFIQGRGFLNGDRDYLRTLLAKSKALGPDRFYAEFLRPLFFDVLAAPAPRPPQIDSRFGAVPYLNGGLFQPHRIEEAHAAAIAIPDAAFDRVFKFFANWDWTIDDRPLKKGEINPDVLGYIFEKYINDQASMGAYYTKEDVTGYICRNTLLPFLLDKVAATQPAAFAPGGRVWSVLARDPLRYLYADVRKGVFDAAGQVLDAPADWATPRTRADAAAHPFALATETRREFDARRARCLKLRDDLAAGAVTSAADLVTLNLDIERFCADLAAGLLEEDAGVLRDLWAALSTLTVLDPTCGSGAFLFAALNVLEPLYTRCLERMRQIAADNPPSSRVIARGHVVHFAAVVAAADAHPSEGYFVHKSIVLNNLFGVDLMAEATEICKLRLFLKLAAQVGAAGQLEPLPDIDFNVRPGNTLVGYATAGETLNTAVFAQAEARRVEESLANLDRLTAAYRASQMERGGGSGDYQRAAKASLRAAQSAAAERFDRQLAVAYGVDPADAAGFAAWRASHRPFHWYAAFHAVLSAGGFDCIVGNPPYVRVGGVDYLTKEQRAWKFSDIYGLVMVRSLQLLAGKGRVGMIVPLSLTFSGDFAKLRKLLIDGKRNWFSSYDNIPASIFAGVSQRCTIWLGDRGGNTQHTAPMYRWRSAFRDNLMSNVEYQTIRNDDISENGIPKISGDDCVSVLLKLDTLAVSGVRQISTKRKGSPFLGFSQAARNFVSVFKEEPPTLDAESLNPISASKVGRLKLANRKVVDAAYAATSGDFYLWYWLVRGDGFDVTSWIVSSFVETLGILPVRHFEAQALLGQVLHGQRFKALQFKKNAGKYVGNFNYRGLPQLTRRADLLMLAGLGATAEEAIAVFDYVERVLAINEFAGEKSIPPALRERLPGPTPDPAAEAAAFAGADAIIRAHFGFADAELARLYKTA